MRNFELFRKLVSAVERLVAQRTTWRFNCGDCARSVESDPPRHDDYMVQALHIACDGKRHRRHADDLYPAVWPR